MDDSEREMRERMKRDFNFLYKQWQNADEEFKSDAFWKLCGFILFMPQDLFK